MIDIGRRRFLQAGAAASAITAPDGVRQNSYLFIDGGNRLRLRVTVTSHRLPGPLVYDLLFRRTPA